MAKVLSFTDSFGETYDASYWRPVQVNLCKEDRSGMVIFYGFPDAARKGKRIIGQKVYSVSGDKYDQYFAATVIDPAGVDHIKQAYQLADDTLDVDSGQRDGNGQPIMQSFFNGAADV